MRLQLPPSRPLSDLLSQELPLLQQLLMRDLAVSSGASKTQGHVFCCYRCSPRQPFPGVCSALLLFACSVHQIVWLVRHTLSNPGQLAQRHCHQSQHLAARPASYRGRWR